MNISSSVRCRGPRSKLAKLAELSRSLAAEPTSTEPRCYGSVFAELAEKIDIAPDPRVGAMAQPLFVLLWCSMYYVVFFVVIDDYPLQRNSGMFAAACWSFALPKFAGVSAERWRAHQWFNREIEPLLDRVRHDSVRDEEVRHIYRELDQTRRHRRLEVPLRRLSAGRSMATRLRRASGVLAFLGYMFYLATSASGAHKWVCWLYGDLQELGEVCGRPSGKTLLEAVQLLSLVVFHVFIPLGATLTLTDFDERIVRAWVGASMAAGASSPAPNELWSFQGEESFHAPDAGCGEMAAPVLAATLVILGGFAAYMLLARLLFLALLPFLAIDAIDVSTFLSIWALVALLMILHQSISKSVDLVKYSAHTARHASSSFLRRRTTSQHPTPAALDPDTSESPWR